MDLLNVEVPAGGFRPVQEIKGSPVPAETVLQNIRDSADFSFPVFVKQNRREGSCIFVAGGPSLRQYVEEIRRRKDAGEFILTSNNTHDWLVERGIVPDACLIFDPKQRVAEYVKRPQTSCTYYLGVTVCKAVFERFRDAAVPVQKVLVAYGLDDESDLRSQQATYPKISGKNYLIGGTMTPLRAIPFASMLGFGKIEFYGFDSSFGAVPPIIHEGEPGFTEAAVKSGKVFYDNDQKNRYVIAEGDEGGFFYAYKKDRTEDVVLQQCGKRRFLTSPAFAYQCKQFIEWADRMEGKIEVDVHGESLSYYALQSYRDKKVRDYATIGDRRWTDEYASLQQTMHETTNYGYRGSQHFELVARMALGLYGKKRATVSILDYGCGQGQLKTEVEAALKFATVTNYDPFQPQYAADPDKHDVIACFDVLEHVEEQCVHNTLRYMEERCKRTALFQVCLVAAKKTLPDGRNAHVTIKNTDWWREKIRRHFHVIEEMQSDVHATFVCQARTL